MPIKIKKIKILIAFFLAFIFLLAAFEVSYAYKIYPYIYINNIEFTGKTKGQAIEQLNTQVDLFLASGLEFVFKNKQINVKSLITGPKGGDIYGEIYSYDVLQTVNEAYDHGHQGGWTKRIKEQLKGFFNSKNIPISFKLNSQGLEDVLRTNLAETEKPAIDAGLSIKVENEEILIKAVAEIDGQAFDYKKATKEAAERLSDLQKQNIIIQTIIDQPEIKKTDVEKIIPQVKEIIELSPVVFNYNDNEWELSRAELADWIALDKIDGQINIIIDPKKAAGFFEIIATEINIEALDAKFEMIDGRVSQFQSSRNGISLNIKNTLKEIDKELLKNKLKAVNLVVDKTEPQKQNGDVNDLGIIELLGRGISDFSGSPKNRIHNITNGANTLNGLLIKPGETFSMIKTLGEIDAANGYLQELVIKGNKTIPEYGGGLCQIGTTAFRTALQSGLPITERRSHSYNVSYYAPTGTDATIYGPHPDFRFKNDTQNHILFLAKIVGQEVIFEFWGTKDGRSIKLIGKEETDDVTKLVPIVYNQVRPGAPKYIETDTLAPGKKKRLEYGHTGADAKFDYIVNYADGRIEEETFKSHYIPWREVWLIGAEEKVEEDEEPVVESEAQEAD